MRASTLFLLSLLVASSLGSLKTLHVAAFDQSIGFDYKSVDYRSVVQSINVSAISEHLKFFTDLGFRMTGTEGCDKASAYILNYFAHMGLKNVSTHSFKVVVPIDYGANLTIVDSDARLRIYPMEPNGVATVSTPGVTGSIIYVGDGSLEALRGLNVTGKILVMEYDTGWNWLNAIRYGAKAVIFVEPAVRYIVSPPEDLQIPVSFLRFWMPRSDAESLLSMISKNGEVTGSITSKMIWEKRTGLNIYGLVEGEDTSQFVIISSRYDSKSTVPSLAPGANEAVGISILLELAKYFTEHKPLYNVVFIAFSGHDQSLAGSRSFVDDIFYPKGMQPFLGTVSSDLVTKLVLGINLELTSFSPEMVLSQWDSYYTDGAGYVWVSSATTDPYYVKPGFYWSKFSQYASVLADSFSQQIGTKLYNGISLRVEGEPPVLYELMKYFPRGFPASDSAPFAYGCCAPYVSLFTRSFDLAPNMMFSPLDTYANLDWKNVEQQAKTTFCFAYTLVRTEKLKQNYLYNLGTVNNYVNYLNGNQYPPVTLAGRVATYNATTASYDSVPNAIVEIKQPWVGSDKFYVMTDSNGGWAAPNMGNTGHSATVGAGRVEVEPYVVNEDTGVVEYAYTQGQHRWTMNLVGTGHQKVYFDMGVLSVFKCVPAVMLDLFYPYSLNMPVPEGGLQYTFQVLDHETTSPAMDYGFQDILDITGTCMAVVYVPPEKSVDILLNTPFLGKIMMALVTDVKLETGEQAIVPHMPLTAAKEIARVTGEYVDQIAAYRIGGDVRERYQALQKTIMESEEAYRGGFYGDSLTKAWLTWSQALKLYMDVRAIVEDAANAIPVFAICTLPFTILFEFAFIKAKGRRKILSLISTFVVLLLIFYVFHPGFRLASNSLIVILGVNVIILSLPVFILLFLMFENLTSRVAKIVKGVHYAEISRGSALILAFQVGIENIVRRKLRSLLLLATILIVVISLTLFTSISSLIIVRYNPKSIAPTYQGILIRDPTWISLKNYLLDYLESSYSDKAYVLPRCWVYAYRSADSNYIVGLVAERGSRTFKYYAALGLSPEEKVFPWTEGVLVEGRWLTEGDFFVCIIPQNMAKEMGVSVGDVIYTFGANYTIVGVMDTSLMDVVVDLDGEQITPFDARIPLQTYMHASSREVVVFPYEVMLQYSWQVPKAGSTILGNTMNLAGVVMVPKNSNESLSISKSIFESFPEIFLYFSTGGITYMYSSETAYTQLGLQTQIAPVTMCFLIILNTMLAAAHERVKDISTYASIGLSPLHVAGIFLAESAVFAVLGSVIGYLASMSIYRLTPILSILPIPMNYSSTWVTTTIFVTMLITIASSLYPALKSAKLVTPSLERVWKIPTKPVGDTWEVSLPVVIVDEPEASAVCSYIEEYIRFHTGEAEAFAVTDLERTEKPELKLLIFKARLIPYEAGVEQKVKLLISLTEKGWTVNISLARSAGPISQWVRLNRTFLDIIRKQFLMWRFLRPEEREKYLKMGV